MISELLLPLPTHAPTLCCFCHPSKEFAPLPLDFCIFNLGRRSKIKAGRSPRRPRNGRPWGEGKKPRGKGNGVGGEEARVRGRSCLSRWLQFQPFFSCTPRSCEVPRTTPLPPPYPTPSLPEICAGGSSGHSPPARHSGPDAGEEGPSFFASFPLVGFEDDIGELGAVCVWWLFWDCVCFDFFFGVCIFPRQDRDKVSSVVNYTFKQ